MLTSHAAERRPRSRREREPPLGAPCTHACAAPLCMRCCHPLNPPAPLAQPLCPTAGSTVIAFVPCASLTARPPRPPPPRASVCAALASSQTPDRRLLHPARTPAPGRPTPAGARCEMRAMRARGAPLPHDQAPRTQQYLPVVPPPSSPPQHIPLCALCVCPRVAPVPPLAARPQPLQPARRRRAAMCAQRRPRPGAIIRPRCKSSV
jgi:hypothetical protein